MRMREFWHLEHGSIARWSAKITYCVCGDTQRIWRDKMWSIPVIAGLGSLAGSLYSAFRPKPSDPAMPQPDYAGFNQSMKNMGSLQNQWQNLQPPSQMMNSLVNQANETALQNYKDIPTLVKENAAQVGQPETMGYGRALTGQLYEQANKEATKLRSQGYEKQAQLSSQYKMQGMEQASKIVEKMAEMQQNFIQQNYHAKVAWGQNMYQAALQNFHAQNQALASLFGGIGNASSAALGGMLYGQNSQVPKTDWRQVANQTVDNPTWNAAANIRQSPNYSGGD